jgi:hypothetical protein
MTRNKSVKNAAVSVAMSTLAGVVAGFLADTMPDLAKKFLAKPRKILGFKIPAELATTLGGGVAGLTFVEALKRLIPGIGDDALDYVQDFAVMVGEELEDRLEVAGLKAGEAAATTDPSSDGRRVPMKPTILWLYNRATKRAVLATCPEAHHIKADGNADTEYRPVDITMIALAAITAPTPVAGCVCAAELQRELDAQKQAQAPKPATTPAGNIKPPSLADFIGKALNSENTATIALVRRLQNLIVLARLTHQEIHLLENCDTEPEFAMLCNCATVAELRAALPLLQAKAERGLMGEAGEKVQHVIGRVWQAGAKYKEGADKRGTEMERQVAVARLCEEYKVSRGEVFAVIKRLYPDELANVGQLTEDHVIRALTVQPGATKSPIEQYWDEQQQKQQRQQPAGTRWDRFKKRLSRLVFGFGG